MRSQFSHFFNFKKSLASIITFLLQLKLVSRWNFWCP
jgi:hypothetical protein